MAPLYEALSVRRAEEASVAGESVWSGLVDLDWTVSVVPNGGYVIGLILEACIAHQKLHPPKVVEPIHVSAHFIRPVQALATKNAPGNALPAAAPFSIRVKLIKGGSSLNNVQAELVQNEQTKVLAHVIFGASYPNNGDNGQQQEQKALVPPSLFARQIPLRTHPLHAREIPLYDVWNFKERISGKEDIVLLGLNEAENRTLASSEDASTREPPGLEFGSWLTFKDNDEPLRPSMLPFCADIIKPLPELLPSEENPLLGKTWYATLTMTIEFKAPIRLHLHTQHTLGLYSLGRFLQDPLGRHETYVEVWTAPSDNASSSNKDLWREEQVCLAVATQTALCIPYESQSKSLKAKA
ncbi:uncharacterized protein FOMMEDRAFT_30863 [Fomitiporia mediterranea MF3/22]|uniref:uncharacterized protein n=1 Tax=Fomitiporia mediterranea (strain MF3/22) TaxID=694068 RepID=UPI00044092C6|nr:uncharacterized protein FOMMEDRAFT_30863 [Fomitiporia mediterranea MF3/22]EJD00219.1 hypothetical protein FOMMEDRAFT_30863 [Fomitiporia mediterranea MF3/22]